MSRTLVFYTILQLFVLVNCLASPSCNPLLSHHHKESHSDDVHYAIDYFCKSFKSTSYDPTDVPINRTIMADYEDQYHATEYKVDYGPLNDVYMFEITALGQSCLEKSLWEPESSVYCTDVFFAAWKQCKLRWA